MLKIIGIIIIVFSIISFIFVGVNFYFVFRRFEKPRYSKYQEFEEMKDKCDREEIKFTSGKHQLQGYLYGPDNKQGLIVICHGVFSGARGYAKEAVYFASKGYQVFSFDYTGYCNSEGKSSVCLYQAVRDLDAALNFIEGDKRFCSDNLFLYGHSWGGYAVSSILSYHHPIDAVVELSGFNKPSEIIIEWAKKEVGPIAVLEYPYVHIVEFILAGPGWNKTAIDAINGCDTPILVVHGEKDNVVGYGTSSIIAYKDKITNPNVEYLVKDQEPQNDHISFYRDKEAIAYVKEIDKQLEELKLQYDNKLPEDVEQGFYDTIDKEVSSAMDVEFFDYVLDFYKKSTL